MRNGKLPNNKTPEEIRMHQNAWAKKNDDHANKQITENKRIEHKNSTNIDALARKIYFFVKNLRIGNCFGNIELAIKNGEVVKVDIHKTKKPEDFM